MANRVSLRKEQLAKVLEYLVSIQPEGDREHARWLQAIQILAARRGEAEPQLTICARCWSRVMCARKDPRMVCMSFREGDPPVEDPEAPAESNMPPCPNWKMGHCQPETCLIAGRCEVRLRAGVVEYVAPETFNTTGMGKPLTLSHLGMAVNSPIRPFNAIYSGRGVVEDLPLAQNGTASIPNVRIVDDGEEEYVTRKELDALAKRVDAAMEQHPTWAQASKLIGEGQRDAIQLHELEAHTAVVEQVKNTVRDMLIELLTEHVRSHHDLHGLGTEECYPEEPHPA